LRWYVPQPASAIFNPLTSVQGAVTLAQHPEQMAELKADPAKWAPAFVEELCRYHTASAMAIKRTAKEDLEIGGKVSLLC
jgi:cytochrome P450